MEFIITNSFSIDMLRHCDGGRTFEVIPINAESARSLVVTHSAKCAIGHPDTARVVANLLGLPELAEPWAQAAEARPTITIGPLRYPERGAPVSLIVAQYSGPRLPAGANALPDGAKIEFWQMYEATTVWSGRDATTVWSGQWRPFTPGDMLGKQMAVTVIYGNQMKP